MMIDVSDDIIELCARAVEDNNTQKRQRQLAGEALTNAQKSKAVLVTYRNVGNINAETVLSRHRDLRILYDHLSQLDDPYSWTIPIENLRPTLNWSGRWGPPEDSMLLVGAYLYGFGNWEAMAKDPKLALEGKFFLEEGKKGEDSASRPIPNAIHLVRRGDFLLGCLKEHDEKLRSYESSLRSKGHVKSSSSPPPTAVASSSHSSSMKKRAESEAVMSVDGGSSAKKRKRRPTPTFTDSESSDEWCVPLALWCNYWMVVDVVCSPSMDETATKEELRPVKRQLVRDCPILIQG
jgi:chromodomain-helicase-DNA-binding protein 1